MGTGVQRSILCSLTRLPLWISVSTCGVTIQPLQSTKSGKLDRKLLPDRGGITKSQICNPPLSIFTRFAASDSTEHQEEN